LVFGVGDSSGAGLFFAPGVAVTLGFGIGVGLVFVFDLRVAGFGLASGSGVSAGVGDVTARISSRALRFFSSSSVNCAFTKVAAIALTARTVPR